MCFRSLFERLRAIFDDEKHPNNKLREIISIAVYLKNKSLINLLKKITQYEIDIGGKPDLRYLHRYEYITYHHHQIYHQKKIDNKVIKCKFFEYKSGNQYRL